MHRRRHGLHHAQALTRLAAGLAVAVAVLGAWAPARADVQKIGPDGTVHRIDVATVTVGKVTGTALRHTRQQPAGGHDSSYVPGTEDVASDRDPALEIDPVSGTPLLVWSRNDGTGYNIYSSRYDGTSWSPMHLLIRGQGDDFEPQIRYASTGTVFHIVWRQQDATGASAYYRESFDATALTLVYGPEKLPLDDASPMSPSGGMSTDGAPDSSWRSMCGYLSGKNPSDPGRIFVWGVRDEPVPISYHQSFTLPTSVTSVSWFQAAWLGGKFTIFLYNGTDRVYYSVYGSTGWSPMDVVEVTSTTSPSDARLLIADLNRRSGGS